MAHLIPERLPRRVTASERRLYSALAGLPDDCLVYFEPVVANRYPDFVVIAPSLGVLTIELKGWRQEDIVGADSQAVLLREPSRVGGADSVVRRTHPVRQARDYMFRLMERCRSHRYAQGLLQHEGMHQGGFCFPFSHVAILANLTVEQLQTHPAGDLTEVFPTQRVLPREALLLLEQAKPAEMLSMLAACFDPTWAFPLLTGAQVNALRAIIHPEIVLTPSLPGLAGERRNTGAPADNENIAPSELKVLDLQQERHARQIGSGHRLVFGVAGSGKTVLLLARARLLASAGPAACQVLVLCYNVTFAAGLRAALADCPGIQVTHFEGWARQNGIVRDRQRGVPLESLESLGQRLQQRLQSGGGDARRFDAVLIDEAQDFEASWFRCALAAMKDPLGGDLLLVGDGNQGLYARRKFRWSDVGIQARGRTVSARFALDRNYRNTREVAALAGLFAAPPSADGSLAEEEGIPALAADLDKCPRVGGQRPVLVHAENQIGECARVLKIVEDLRAGRWFGSEIPAPEPEQIAILYRAVRPAKEKLFRRFLGALGRIAPTAWLTEPGRLQARERVGERAIKVQTIHSAKGLQYKAVVVLWADELPASFGDTSLDAERRLFYVALTRAEDWLAMTSCRSSLFTEEILRSAHIAVA